MKRACLPLLGALLIVLLAAPRASLGDAGVLIPRNKQQPDPQILSLEEMEITIRIDNGDARVFCIMELLEGESLADVMERDPLTLQLATKVCCELSQALHAAHSVGVVHRELVALMSASYTAVGILSRSSARSLLELYLRILV